MDAVSGRFQDKYSGIRQEAISGCCRADLGLNWGLFLTICLRSIYDIPALRRQTRIRPETAGQKGFFTVSLTGTISARGRSVSRPDTVETVLCNLPTIHLRQQLVAALPARKSYRATRYLKVFPVDPGEAAWRLRRAVRPGCLQTWVWQSARVETFPQSGSRLLSQPPTLSRICPFSGIIRCMG